MRNVASCVGKFEAANSYASYVDGLTASRASVEASFTQLSRIMRLADNRSLTADIAAAKEEFQAEMWSDPVYIQSTIRAMEADCSRQISHVQEFKVALERKDAQAEAALKEERVARQKLDADIALKEQERKLLIAQTENEKAVAERIKLEEVAKERDLERTKELALLKRESALSRGKVVNAVDDQSAPHDQQRQSKAEIFSPDALTQIATCSAFYMQFLNEGTLAERKLYQDTGRGLVYMVALNGGSQTEFPTHAKALSKRIAQATIDGRKDQEFRKLTKDCAALVKKYDAALEHALAKAIIGS